MFEDKSGMIIEYLRKKGEEASVEEIAAHLSISSAMVYRKITRLREKGEVIKSGKKYQLKGFKLPVNQGLDQDAKQPSLPQTPSGSAATIPIQSPSALPSVVVPESPAYGRNPAKGGDINREPSTLATSGPPIKAFGGDKNMKEDVLRTADDLGYRIFGWEMYNRGKLFIENIWFVRFLFKNKVISRPLVIVGIIGLITWMGLQYWWIPSRQNQLAQTRQELEQAKVMNADLRSLVAQQQSQSQEQQKNFEDQIKALQQQIQSREAQKPAPTETSAPVDYDALVQHPFSNAGNTMNFVKGWFKPKTKPAVEISPSPLFTKEREGGVKTQQEIQMLRQQIIQLQNQNKQWRQQIQDKDRALSGLTQNFKDAKNQIDQLTQENRRLHDRYLNEEGINQDLENKLKAVMAEKPQVSTEKDFSIQFDENGDRVK